MFEKGNMVGRNKDFLIEAYTHLAPWAYNYISDDFVGRVVEKNGKEVKVQWEGPEWEKAGPLTYWTWQLNDLTI